MRKLLLHLLWYTLVGGVATPLPSWAQQPTYVWAASGGGPSYDSGNYVATDPAGNVYQAGLFSGDARFGGLALTAATNALDIFLAKYLSHPTQAALKGWVEVRH